jgi:hypothetical protein
LTARVDQQAFDDILLFAMTHLFNPALVRSVSSTRAISGKRKFWAVVS